MFGFSYSAEITGIKAFIPLKFACLAAGKFSKIKVQKGRKSRWNRRC